MLGYTQPRFIGENMKYVLIKYRFKNGSREEWHRGIERFISDLENDPDLSGKISYRSMKSKGSDNYYHIATVTDDHVAKTLNERDFFLEYTKKCELVAGGEDNVEVSPLEIIAETKEQLRVDSDLRH